LGTPLVSGVGAFPITGGQGAGAGTKRSSLRDLTPCALLLFPARSAGREHRFSLGGFRCFSRRLLGQPSRLGFFPGLTLSFASCPLGSLPGGQLGRLLFPGRASGRFAFRYPAIAGGRDLVTSLEPLGAFGVFGHIFCAFELSLFGGVCHAQAIGKIGCSHREL
jgi:hypothetical protein